MPDSYSKTIVNTSSSNQKKKANTPQKNSPKKAKKNLKKWSISIFFILIFTGIAFLFYELEIGAFLYQQIGSNQAKNSPQVKNGLGSEIQQLHTEIRDLEEQFKSLQSETNINQKSLLNSLKKNQQSQQQQLSVFTAQMAQFTTQINRWKVQLSNSKTLLEIIQGQLKLVQTQSLMNYSPFLLAQQLSVIKQMLEELKIDGLLNVRIELDSLIQRLDLKPVPPIEFWLSELQFANRSISLWIQQQKDSFPSNIAKENSLTNDSSQAPNNQGSNFFDKLKNHVRERLGSSLNISKSEHTSNANIPLTPLSNQSFNPEHLHKQFQSHIESLRLGLLSHSWDQIRIQSLDLYQWIGENLSNVDTNLKETLAQMSQYKSKDIHTSLVNIIQLIEDYRNKTDSVPTYTTIK